MIEETHVFGGSRQEVSTEYGARQHLEPCRRAGRDESLDAHGRQETAEVEDRGGEDAEFNSLPWVDTMKMSSEIHVEAESHVRIEQNRVGDREVGGREEAGQDTWTENVNRVERVRDGARRWEVVRQEGARSERREPFRPVDSKVAGVRSSRRGWGATVVVVMLGWLGGSR